jgi:hypothetical protein
MSSVVDTAETITGKGGMIGIKDENKVSGSLSLIK